MATDPFLLDRIRQIMNSRGSFYTEKKMFGGNCFMIDDKMCFGTYKGGLMVRIAPEDEDELVKKPYSERMIHGGRPMKGFLFVQPEGYDNDDDLAFWIRKAMEFNPRAKSSKK